MMRAALVLLALVCVAHSVQGSSSLLTDDAEDLALTREAVEYAGGDFESFMNALSMLEEGAEAETVSGKANWSRLGSHSFVKLPDSEYTKFKRAPQALDKLRLEMRTRVLSETKYGRWWLEVVEKARKDSEASRTENGLYQLRRIHARANDNLYKRDPLGKDHWKTPNVFLTGGGGDCEDFALLKYDGLLRLGFDSQDMMILLGRDGKLRNQLHAVLAVQHGGKYYVLDNNLHIPLDFDVYISSRKFKVRYLINEHAVWAPSHKESVRPLGQLALGKIVRRATLDKKDYGPCTNHLGTCLHMTWCEQQGHSWVSRKCPGLADAIRCCTGGVQARATSAGEAGAPELKVLRIKSTSVEAPALEEGHEAMCAFSSNEGDKMDQTSVLVMTPWSSGHKFGEGTLVLPYADGHKLFARCVARKCEAGKCGGEEEQEGDQVVVKGVVDLTEVATEEDVFSSVFHAVRLGTEDAKWTGNVQKAFADQDELQ